MAQTIQTYSLTPTPTSTSSAQDVVKTALNILRPHLPASLPLYRRLQFGRFFDATCLLTNLDLTDRFSPSFEAQHDRDNTQPPWVIAFIDRSCRPETEVWMFGSWETSPPPPSATIAWKEIDNLMLDLVRTAKSLGVPTSIHQDVLDAELHGSSESERDTVGYSRADYGGHASNIDIMLWGAVHERTVPSLQRLDLLSHEYKTSDAPNHSFLFDVATLPEPKPLPEGLEWDAVRPEAFALIRSRTQIPRQEKTMAVLPSLAIFPTTTTTSGSPVLPIAWAFIGADASLTTLHVEPEWRGRGLAKLITAKLFREKMDNFLEDGVERVAHGYVIVGNKASEGMCRSLGGKAQWECYWLRVDLSKA